MPQFCYRSFTCPKQGNNQEQFEDAWGVDLSTFRLAVADGASDSFDSRQLAQLVVDAYIHEPPLPNAESVLAWFAPIAEMWRDNIAWSGLPWYAEAKAKLGSFATLLGIEFEIPHEDAPAEAIVRWHAMAVGDVCLFQVRGENLIVRFPVQTALDFSSTPALLSTRSDYTRRSLAELMVSQGNLCTGDLLFIATDALAAWFLHKFEQGEYPWAELNNLSNEHFDEFVDRYRRGGSLQNDDVTLVILWFEQ